MIFTQSLKKNYQFRYVYSRGRSIANKFLVMYVIKNDNKKNNRLGISVSKKVGNSVVRSRVTRLIREAYRLNETNFKKGYNIVVIARPSTNDIAFKEMEKALKHLIYKHKLFEKINDYD